MNGPGKRLVALEEPPHGLAMLRIAVAAIVLISPELHAAAALARTPELLVASPEGLGWLRDVAIAPELVAWARLLAISAGASALLGYWSRLSCAVLALTATFLVSFTQRAGAVLHDMHLLWMLVLLAASRCGDALSLDAWGRAGQGASIAYGLPLCGARALLGVVYFFPGLHKLTSTGLDWASAENVTALLYGKWLQHGELPWLRVDRAPWLLVLGGACAVLFELSFIVLALLPKTRLIALGLGLTFHAATQLFFFIPFPSLWVCYVVLVPWAALLRRWPGLGGEPKPGAAGLPWPSVVSCGLLLVAASVQGLRGLTQAFPVACYPTFAGRAPSVAPDLIVELVSKDGGTLQLTRDLGQSRSQQEWARVYALLGAYGDRASDSQLRAFARRQALARGALPKLLEARALRILVAEYSTRPSDWGKPPLRSHLLRTLAP